MVYLIIRIILSAIIVLSVYHYGVYEGKKLCEKKQLTQLYLPEKCDGCKKIKPVVSNLKHDRFGKVTGVCIGCSKFGTCGGRKDKE